MLQPSFFVRIFALVMVLATVPLAGLAVRRERASAQVPNEGCIGAALNHLWPIDERLDLLDVSGSVLSIAAPPGAPENQDTVDQVQITWSLPAAIDAVRCIWVGIRPPGVEGYMFTGDMRLAPTMTELTHIPMGQPGEWCYQLVGIGYGVMSRPSPEACLQVSNPQRHGPTPRATVPPATAETATPASPSPSTPASPSPSTPAPPRTGLGAESGGSGLLAPGAVLLAVGALLGLRALRR